MAFFVKVRRGWLMGLIAYEFIMENKKVLLFTLFSTILICITALSMIGFILVKTGFIESIRQSILHQHAVGKIQHHIPHSIGYAVGFLVLTSIISIFVDVALAFYVGNIFENKPSSFTESLSRSFSRFIIILEWAVISYIIGVIAQSIRNQKGFFGKIIGWLISGLLELAWSILTFFVIPIIATEDLGIIAAIEKSGQSMKKTFGQNVGATFALGTANFILFSIVSTLVWGIAFICWWLFAPALPYSHQGAMVMTFIVLGLIALPILIVTPITSAANTIFRVASYNYANGKPTGPFSTQMIKESFVAKVM
jgi:hypothetical protein